MNSKKVKESIKKVFNDIHAMSDEDFFKEIEKHKNGKFAQLLQYAGFPFCKDITNDEQFIQSINEMLDELDKEEKEKYIVECPHCGCKTHVNDLDTNIVSIYGQCFDVKCVQCGEDYKINEIVKRLYTAF